MERFNLKKLNEVAGKEQYRVEVSTRFEALEDLNDKQTNKLHGLSPRANYTDRAAAACRRSDCQLLRIEGATWSA
jgi:hypothetical protein